MSNYQYGYPVLATKKDGTVLYKKSKNKKQDKKAFDECFSDWDNMNLEGNHALEHDLLPNILRYSRRHPDIAYKFYIDGEYGDRDTVTAVNGLIVDKNFFYENNTPVKEIFIRAAAFIKGNIVYTVTETFGLNVHKHKFTDLKDINTFCTPECASDIARCDALDDVCQIRDTITKDSVLKVYVPQSQGTSISNAFALRAKDLQDTYARSVSIAYEEIDVKTIEWFSMVLDHYIFETKWKNMSPQEQIEELWKSLEKGFCPYQTMPGSDAFIYGDKTKGIILETINHYPSKGKGNGIRYKICKPENFEKIYNILLKFYTGENPNEKDWKIFDKCFKRIDTVEEVTVLADRRILKCGDLVAVVPNEYEKEHNTLKTVRVDSLCSKEKFYDENGIQRPTSSVVHILNKAVTTTP